ncbi:hypothetical protein CERSUDRAFT_99812 [Gelatoporia subvermispora B]|uniref:F-box domain-containing protein n=1 Tax=Ceriporiopsis subvermispora (strain B) TaxID=914234 RepID=M2R1K4_CERS8|nr:hypothetical protein CERSUDRAFT_99812 [Gelatoporia subvermispora B]
MPKRLARSKVLGRVDSRVVSRELKNSLVGFNGRVDWLDPVSLLEADRALVASLASVRQRRNGLCTINRLPPEVLAMIFGRLARIIKLDEWPWKSNIRTCKDLVPITRVCKYWRAVVLGVSHLWTYITPDVPSEVSLARSNGMPLRMCIKSDHEQLLDQILLSGRPLLELECDCVDIHGETISENPAPHLESFALVNHYLGDWHDVDLFAGQAPRLQQFALARTRWPLPAHPLPALKRLSIQSCYNIRLSGLALLFSASPYLEHLVFQDTDLIPDHEPNDTVHMDHLQSIYVTAISSETASAIFSSITVNSDTAVYVSDTETLIIPQCYSELDICRLMIWQLPAGVTLAATGPFTAIWSSCSFYSTDVDRAEPYAAMHKLPLAQVTELWVESTLPPIWETPGLDILVHALTSLTTLYAYNPQTNFKLSQIIETVSGLQTLHVHFRCDTDDSREDEQDVLQICAIAEERKHAGHPIPRVVLNVAHRKSLSDRCFRKAVERLEEEVEEVEFDYTGATFMTMPARCTARLHACWEPWPERLGQRRRDGYEYGLIN